MDAPSKRSRLQIILLFLCVCIVSSFTDIDDDFEVASDSVLVVEHTFDKGLEPKYTKRGTIVIQSIKSGAAEFSQERPLNDDEIHKLKELVETDDVYRIRIATKSAEGNIVYVSSFVKACALYESGLTDKLTVHMDTPGSVIGVSLTTTAPYCIGLGDKPEHSSFQTSVDVMQTVPGSVPETQSYIEKMERDKAEKAQGQQPDNRSFFGKYWMYIVPVVVIMMFANSQDPNAGGGGGGGR